MASISLPPNYDNIVKLLYKSSRVPNDVRPEVSLAGKTALITGSNIGIGLACAQIMPMLGLSHLIFAVRSVMKGEEASTSIRKAHPNLKVEIWELDMLSYTSVRTFSERCATLPRLDIAILNAGMGTTASNINQSTGHEETIQVNYLSTALLGILLLPVLKPKVGKQEAGRLTIVGSAMGLYAAFENRNAVPLIPSFDLPFSGFASAGERYSVSKTLVMMLVQKMSEAVSADDVIVNTVEPGLTSGTALHRNFTGVGKFVMAVLKKLISRTPEEAAWTYVDAAVAKGRESHGGFILFWEIFPFHRMMYTLEGKKTTERLWEETLVELEFAGVRNILDSMHKPNIEGTPQHFQ